MVVVGHRSTILRKWTTSSLQAAHVPWGKNLDGELWKPEAKTLVTAAAESLLAEQPSHMWSAWICIEHCQLNGGL